ncbi:MAG: DUF2278 family protein, partial [Thermoanaerobaculia bacterium]
LVDDDFRHPITAALRGRALGFYRLGYLPADGGLDYIRGNLFDRAQMRPLPFNVPGFDNDLNEKIDRVMQRAVSDEAAVVYAFGQRWGPEPGKKDKYFGFLPGNGIHDIHMNQGNAAGFVDQDGVWQDGGLFVHFPDQQQWVAIFLKFQSQSWHTDDVTGHSIGAPPGTVPPRPDELPTTEEPFGIVRIVAALVNAKESPEVELVTLINTAPHPVSLAGWALLDTQKKRLELSGTIGPGETRTLTIRQPLALSNQGGVITLVDENGLKVHGVSYTREQARNPGWTLVF